MENKDLQTPNSDTYSNKLFIELKKKDENDKCFGCNAQPANWADLKNGIFLCAKCSGEHRQFPSEVSEILSIVLDEWIEEELNQMKNGGNKRLKEYLEDIGIVQKEFSKRDLFEHKVMTVYRNDLKSENEAITEENTPPIPMDYLNMY